MPKRIKPKIPVEKPHYIKEWRESRGMEPEELAARLSCHPNTIYRIETFRRDYTGELLAAISEVLGASPCELIGRDPNEQASPWEAKDLFERIPAHQRPAALSILRPVVENAGVWSQPSRNDTPPSSNDGGPKSALGQRFGD